VQQRLPSVINPPIGFAHRGAMAHAPQNTMEAFRLALRLGATGIESDVWLTADGLPVLDHDGIVRIGRRKRSIGDVARAELPADVPTLADLCGLHHGESFHLSLDVCDGKASEVVAVVRAVAPTLLPNLWLCHPDRDLVASWRSLDDTIKLVWSTRFAALQGGPERAIAWLREHHIDVLNMHYTDWTGGLTTLAHRFDVLALAWDLQHDHLLDKLLLMGVDGIFSDWPDRMTEALARHNHA
jgi:glycerophosphoryl diester phosphodiesterase